MENVGISEDLSKAMVDKLVDIGNQMIEVQDYLKRIMVLQKPTEKLVEGVEKMNAVAESGEGILQELAQWRNEMNELKAQMAKHIQYFEQPAQKEIHHKHFVGKPLEVIVCLVIIIGVLAAFLVRAWQ